MYSISDFTTDVEVMSMYGNYQCEDCGCTLDPGEGRLCDDCREKKIMAQSREMEIDRMIRSTNYEQMEMEEFIHG